MDSGTIKRIQKCVRRLVGDQNGITGLETAIVLIAFVVVAAVFAFTVLTTGLFTSEKAKETTMAGVTSANSSLELVGGVIAGGTNIGTTCRTPSAAGNAPITTPPYENQQECDIDWNVPEHIQTVRFRLGLAAGVEDLNFDPNDLLITFQDEGMNELLSFNPVRTGGAPTDADIRADNAADWNNCRGRPNATFCIQWSEGSDRDFVLERGETVEIIMTCVNNNNPLHNQLHAGDQFRFEVIHPQGFVFAFERRFPPVFRWVMNLG